jgi:signal transduction histidine kinase
VAEGEHADELRGATFPPKGSISGEVIRSGRAILVPDAARDARAYQPVVKLGDMGPMILVPLAERDRAIGTLNAARVRGGRPFTQEDVELLQRFADQAAIALEYARAQREAQRVAIMEDRERIAKELHDGVIQSLFAVGMGLQGTALMSSDGEQTERVEGAVAELDRVIRDLRNYIFGLRPGILADRQLDQALRQTAQEFEARSGVVTVVEIDETVAAELASSAADVIQGTREALSNVGRHAAATTCRVSLHREDGTAVLEVDDDGRGFDPANTPRGDGLSNLEQRAEALGGKASIESAPTQGTTVRLVIPLEGIAV